MERCANRGGTGAGRGVRAAVTLVALATAAWAGDATTKVKPRKGMELPPELKAGTTELKVADRKLFFWPDKPVAQMLKLGPYRVVDFRKGWTKGRSSGAELAFREGWTFQWTADTRAYDYSFDVVGDGESRWTCSCASASTTRGAFFESEHMGVGIPGHGQSRLACVLRAPQDEVEWRLELGVDLEPALLPVKTAVGWLRHAGDEVSIIGTERMQKWGRAPGRLVGLVLAINDRPVAAVDVVSNAAVILGGDLSFELREPVAVAGAALLLFSDDLDPFPSGPG
jgi:hypothetical protein